MAIKTEMLRCFCIVAQTGTLADAADRLGRTQSAVSMTLKQLEEHLGKKLFEGERKNRLSPFGEEVLELALGQIRRFDQTVRDIEQAAQASHGLIRIAAVPSVAALVFPSVLDHMTRRFPNIRMELRDTDSEQVLDALSQGKSDIGIASMQHQLNGVDARLLFKDRFGVICSANHPLARKADDLYIRDVVGPWFLHNALCDLIETQGFQAAIDRSHAMVHNTLSLIEMVRTGKWVTVLPETVARFAPDSVVFRPLSDLPDRREVFLYRREKSRFAMLAQECCDHIISMDFAETAHRAI